MAVQHANIIDSERHEPKGASTATVDQVYASNGAGSGTWREVPYIVYAEIPDVSTASSILIPTPANLKIQSIRLTLANAITLANAVITVTRSDGAVIGTANIPHAVSGPGTTIDLTPSGNNTIVAASHNYIKIETDGASTTVSKLFIALKVKAV